MSFASEHERRVLLIGWDSIDRQAVDSLLRQGSMPALGRISSEGGLGRLSPVRPLVSPMLWTSLATGVRADKHRILGFYTPNESGEGLRRVASEDRQRQALWNWTSDAGLTTHVVGWPATSPSESVRGAMVSDACLDLGEPGEWLPQRFPKRLGPEDTESSSDSLRQALNEWTPSESFVHRHAELLEQAAAQGLATEALRSLLNRLTRLHGVACVTVRRQPWALSAVCYPTVASWVAAASANDGLVAAAWRLQDAMLGDLVQLAGQRSTVVLVSPQASNPSERGMGLLGMAGPGVTAGAPIVGSTVLDVAPTIAHLLGLQVAADLDGRALSAFASAPSRPIGRLVTTVSAAAADGARADSEESPVESSESLLDQVRLNHRVNLALALSDSDRVAQAADAWRDLHKDYPDDPVYAVKLVDSLLRRQDYEACRDVVQRLPAPVAEQAAIRLAVARIAQADGDIDGAVRAATEVASRDDATPKHLLAAAQLLVACDAEAEAIAPFRRCLERGGRNPIAMCGLASALWKAERYDESVEAAQAALDAAPAYSEARFRLAQALRSCGRENDAIEQFEHCLQSGWSPVETHAQLASLYWGRDSDRAWRHRQLAGVA